MSLHPAATCSHRTHTHSNRLQPVAVCVCVRKCRSSSSSNSGKGKARAVSVCFLYFIFFSLIFFLSSEQKHATCWACDSHHLAAAVDFLLGFITRLEQKRCQLLANRSRRRRRINLPLVDFCPFCRATFCATTTTRKRKRATHKTRATQATLMVGDFLGQSSNSSRLKKREKSWSSRLTNNWSKASELSEWVECVWLLHRLLL